jgi:hypothetical protein
MIELSIENTLVTTQLSFENALHHIILEFRIFRSEIQLLTNEQCGSPLKYPRALQMPLVNVVMLAVICFAAPAAGEHVLPSL